MIVRCKALQKATLIVFHITLCQTQVVLPSTEISSLFHSNNPFSALLPRLGSDSWSVCRFLCLAFLPLLYLTRIASIMYWPEIKDHKHSKYNKGVLVKYIFIVILSECMFLLSLVTTLMGECYEEQQDLFSIK